MKPLKLTVWRKWLFSDESIGKLYVNGKFSGIYTLEDEVRGAGQKVYGDTAIPYGKYPVKITYSPKFKKDMPAIEDVPGFDGIRIHTGNNESQTAGCLLVGLQVDGNKLQNSAEAFNILYPKIREAQNEGREVTIEFVNTEKWWAKRILIGLAILGTIIALYHLVFKPKLNEK